MTPKSLYGGETVSQEVVGFSAFFDLIPWPVFQLNKDGRIIAASAAAKAVFGNNKIEGQSWIGTCPGITRETWHHIINGTSPYVFETQVADARLSFSHVVSNPTGFIFVFGSYVSSKEELEEKLAAQSAVIAQMARFPDMNPGPVLRMDLDGVILLSNKVATSLFGEDLLNKRWRDICPGLPEDRWQTIITADTVIPVEATIGDKHFIFNHRRDAQTNLVFTYGTDITANKLIEHQLEEQKSKVMEVARFPDMNPGPVLRMSIDGIILLCNAAAQKVFGDDLTNKNWLAVCSGMNENTWLQIVQTENVFPFETRIGEKYFVFNHRTDFQTNLVFTFGTDITYQKLTEKQLVHAEKMAALGELTAGIAHEIQNPLNFVNNFSEVSVELIEDMKLELAGGNQQQAIVIADDIEQNLQKINHHGKRADAIVKGMLQHSRASSGIKEATDINALAGEYLRLSYHGLRAKNKAFNASFKTDFDERIDMIKVVPQDIGRVLLNLYNNAFYAAALTSKASPDENKGRGGLNASRPTVWVTTKKEDGNITISVKDNGPGIPKNIVDKIFQPFFTTKPTGEGTGLGLSLSYDIMKAHGGEMKVETKEGEGAEFIIQLPAD